MTDDICSHNLQIPGTPNQVGYGYYCRLAPGHSGLHRWDDKNNIERARVWTDDGIDFLEGPYLAASDPKSLTCSDHFEDGDGTVVYCVRPKGHSGQHGNYHDEPNPTYWAGYEALPAALSAWGTAEGMKPYGASNSAHFEVVIDSGKLAIPKKLRLNGMELPNVKDVTVEYSQGDVRTVIIEILATSVTEVSQ